MFGATFEFIFTVAVAVAVATGRTTTRARTGTPRGPSTCCAARPSPGSTVWSCWRPWRWWRRTWPPSPRRPCAQVRDGVVLCCVVLCCVVLCCVVLCLFRCVCDAVVWVGGRMCCALFVVFPVPGVAHRTALFIFVYVFHFTRALIVVPHFATILG
jgi:hypothetical protein